VHYQRIKLSDEWRMYSLYFADPGFDQGWWGKGAVLDPNQSLWIEFQSDDTTLAFARGRPFLRRRAF
jgi:hypothetical protein